MKKSFMEQIWVSAFALMIFFKSFNAVGIYDSLTFLTMSLVPVMIIAGLLKKRTLSLAILIAIIAISGAEIFVTKIAFFAIEKSIILAIIVYLVDKLEKPIAIKNKKGEHHTHLQYGIQFALIFIPLMITISLLR